MPMDFIPPKGHIPIFISGMWYRTISEADEESGISAVSLWKALKKRQGFPVRVRKSLVVTEYWVAVRLNEIKGYFSL